MTGAYPVPDDDEERLVDLATYAVAHVRDPELDAMAAAARILLDADYGLVSFVDRREQWFGGRSGLAVDGTPREQSMCSHAILEDDTMVVEDASKDVRFHDNPLVTGDLQIRGYAGAVVRSASGQPLGTVCAIRREPGPFEEEDVQRLRGLRDAVEALLHARRQSLLRLVESERDHV